MEQSIISAEYLSAVKAIKQAILESRYRAARHVNKEMLTLYYWVGHYVSVHSRVDAWKTNAIGVISKMLQQELPGLTGFSETNIKNMRIFYEAWSPVLNRQMSSADCFSLCWFHSPQRDYQTNHRPSRTFILYQKMCH